MKTFEWNGILYNYSITTWNVHIEDSYAIKKSDFVPVLKALNAANDHSLVWERSYRSLKREWACHNLAYALGYKRAQTKDVDLDYPQSRWTQFKNSFVGFFALIFIK